MTKPTITKMLEHYQNSKVQEQTKLREILHWSKDYFHALVDHITVEKS